MILRGTNFMPQTPKALPRADYEHEDKLTTRILLGKRYKKRRH